MGTRPVTAFYSIETAVLGRKQGRQWKLNCGWNKLPLWPLLYKYAVFAAPAAPLQLLFLPSLLQLLLPPAVAAVAAAIAAEKNPIPHSEQRRLVACFQVSWPTKFHFQQGSRSSQSFECNCRYQWCMCDWLSWTAFWNESQYQVYSLLVSDHVSSEQAAKYMLVSLWKEHFTVSAIHMILLRHRHFKIALLELDPILTKVTTQERSISISKPSIFQN